MIQPCAARAASRAAAIRSATSPSGPAIRISSAIPR